MPIFRLDKEEKLFVLNKKYNSEDDVEFLGNWILVHSLPEKKLVDFFNSKKNAIELAYIYNLFQNTKTLRRLRNSQICMDIYGFLADMEISDEDKIVSTIAIDLNLSNRVAGHYIRLLEKNNIVTKVENKNDKRQSFITIVNDIDELISAQENELFNFFKKNKPF